MFNSLLGSKFSKKCKYCLKCISSRVQLIRKKRQATVRCLKKDVAELLASGHDSKAFARIEALIVEINHASCYDMIEQYGQCILNQLSGLQKQRECPEGAMEAISTLIFAAARFSDLPELSDLRQVFTERYGSQMESSVDALFVEKVQKKSFSMNKKLQLMQDIADEFSVRWDSQAFRQKQSNPNAPPLDQPKRSSNNNSAVNQCEEAVFDAASEVTAQNRAALNAAASVNRRKEPIFTANVAGNVRKEGVTNLRDPVNNKDGAVLNAAGSFNRRKEAVLSADIAFNEKKEAVTNSSRDGAAVLNGGGSFNGRKEVALDADIKVNGRKETAINSKNEAALSTGGDREVPYKERWVPPLRSSVQKQQVQPEPRDIHVIPTIRNGRRVSTTAEETENVEPAYDNKAKGNYTDVLKDDWSKTPKVRQNGIHKDWLNGTAWARSPVGQEEPGLIGLESQSAAPVVSRDVKAVNMVPPHKRTVDDSPVYDDDIPRAVNKVLDPSVHEARPSLPMRSKDARPISLIPPPYTKPHLRKSSTLPDDNKLTDEPIKSYIAVDYEKSDIGDRGKPVSVRRRIPKPALGIETEHTTTPSRRLLNGDLYDAEVADRWERKEKVGVADRRQHEVKRLDVEEEAMDRLLAHYSKKGTSNEPSRRRTRTKPPPVEPAKDQSTAESLRYRPERVASLPPELTTPVVEGGVGRRPVRATSLQPDSISPNGGRLHPRLPDYDDLAARFIALKHG